MGSDAQGATTHIGMSNQAAAVRDRRCHTDGSAGEDRWRHVSSRLGWGGEREGGGEFGMSTTQQS